MYRLPFTETRGCTGVTKTLIVSNKATVKNKKGAGTLTGTWKKTSEIYTAFLFSFWKATRRTCWHISDQTSNRNGIMNFYRLGLGLFKDFLLWFGDTMAAVCLCVPGLAHEKTRGAH